MSLRKHLVTGFALALLLASVACVKHGGPPLALEECDPAGYIPCMQAATFVSLPITDSNLFLLAARSHLASIWSNMCCAAIDSGEGAGHSAQIALHGNAQWLAIGRSLETQEPAGGVIADSNEISTEVSVNGSNVLAGGIENVGDGSIKTRHCYLAGRELDTISQAPRTIATD